MRNETGHQEMKQISTALLETLVSRTDPESSRWSTASSKTGPSRGHLFSPDPEACRRGDSLWEHKESQSICSPTRHLGWGSANRRLDGTSAAPSSVRLVKMSSRQSVPALCCTVTSPSSIHGCSKAVDVGVHEAQSEECFCSCCICINRGCAARQR